MTRSCWQQFLWSKENWGGILGREFNKKLESSAPCCSGWFEENQTLLWFLKNITKNQQNKKTRVCSWTAFCRTEKWGLKPEKRVYAQKSRIQMPFKDSISREKYTFCLHFKRWLSYVETLLDNCVHWVLLYPYCHTKKKIQARHLFPLLIQSAVTQTRLYR